MAVLTLAIIPGRGALAMVRMKERSDISALWQIDRKAAQTGLLEFGTHLLARLTHGFDAIVERHEVRAVPAQRQGSCGDRFHRPDAIAFDARDLDEPGDGIASHAEMVL